jgi:chromosome segregation ATPase
MEVKLKELEEEKAKLTGKLAQAEKALAQQETSIQNLRKQKRRHFLSSEIILFTHVSNINDLFFLSLSVAVPHHTGFRKEK